MTVPHIALVVARARNGVIGRDGDLPWKLRGDLQRFKAITQGKPCLMGRSTWESLPLRPLPGRLNLVLSRDLSYEEAGKAKGAVVCANLGDAIDIARETAEEDGAPEICVIGGTALFEAAAERGLIDACQTGELGYPMVNAQARIIDAKFDQQLSTEDAFVAAIGTDEGLH